MTKLDVQDTAVQETVMESEMDQKPDLDDIFNTKKTSEDIMAGIEFGLEDFDPKPFQPTVKKLSIMDQERFMELQRNKHRLLRMREDLIRADLDDYGNDLFISEQRAQGINKNYGNLVR